VLEVPPVHEPFPPVAVFETLMFRNLDELPGINKLSSGLFDITRNSTCDCISLLLSGLVVVSMSLIPPVLENRSFEIFGKL
jgi:hypothetical protein